MNRQSFDSVNDIFDEHRKLVLKWFLLAMCAVLLPFDVNHFIQERYLLGAALAGTLALFFASAAGIHFQWRATMPHVVVFLPIAATLWSAITTQGVTGTFWVYPCVLLAHYTLPRFQANVVALALSVMATALAYAQLSPAIALRIGATLAVTTVLANIFLGSIARLNTRLLDLATVDPLTGASTRHQLEAIAQGAAERKRRYGTPMSMLLIDVDHFKKINDRFGHAAGDTVLREVAARLRASIRTIDLLFRVGGEEFLVLLPESGLSGALRVAEKLRLAVAAQPMLGDHQVTISIGAGELAADEDSRGLLKRCDDALYQAKSAGRNRVCTADGGQLAAAPAP